MNNSTCPYCGAERDDSSVRYLISFSCGTIFDTDECVTFGRSDDCYERQLAAKDAEIERLKQAVLDERELGSNDPDAHLVGMPEFVNEVAQFADYGVAA